jgi:nucleoid DNA-binding protein
VLLSVPLDEEIASLTKADLIDVVAGETEITKRQAGEVVDLILAEIKAALQKGDRVALTPFGSFVVRSRKAREGRNPKTGEKIKIAARKVPAFVAGRALKDAVSGNRSSASKKSPVKKAAKKGAKRR